jgi:hypothetical protein
MMRQARGNLSLLLRMQAARRKVEANNEAGDRAAWVEHCAAKLMTEALSEQPHPAAITQPSPPSDLQPAPESADQPQPAANSATYPRTIKLIHRIGRITNISDENLTGVLVTALTTHNPLLLQERAGGGGRTP